LEDILKKMMAEIPGFVWRTTFIIGFPGETEAHVDELIDFIERYPVVQLGCFPYSEERETRSARLPDKVAPEVIEQRIHRVMTRQFELVQARNQALVGQTLRVLIDKPGVARSYREAPDVDGRILFDADAAVALGQFYDVRITEVSGYDLLGDFV